MDIAISGRHFKITDAIRDKIETKLGHLSKYDSHITSADVIVSVDAGVHKIEITMNVPKNSSLHAEAEADILYDAIDAVEEKIKAQVLKHKGKWLDKRDHRG